VKVTQRVSPAVPVRVVQAALQQLEDTFSLPVAAPADAHSVNDVRRGGIDVAVPAEAQRRAARLAPVSSRRTR